MLTNALKIEENMRETKYLEYAFYNPHNKYAKQKILKYSNMFR